MPEDLRPYYVMVSRRLVLSWLASFITLAIMTMSAALWANYVDRRSNQRWCRILVISDDAYKASPPKDPIQQEAALEFKRLRKEFECKT